MRPCERIIFSAPSMASVPELQKKVRCKSAGLGQTFRQRPLILVVVEIGSVQQQAGLLANHFREARVRVAQRVDADAGDEIQIALAGSVVDIAAFAALQKQRIARVILQQILALQRANPINDAGLFRNRWKQWT